MQRLGYALNIVILARQGIGDQLDQWAIVGRRRRRSSGQRVNVVFVNRAYNLRTRVRSTWCAEPRVQFLRYPRLIA